MIDCGNTPDFDPIDVLIEYNLIPGVNGRPQLSQLILTNYDQDHFSGLPGLRSKVYIRSVIFAKNLSSIEIKLIKPTITRAVTAVCEIKEEYINDLPNTYTPPFKTHCFTLSKNEFTTSPSTNDLSQLVFIDYNGFVICVPGDLEHEGWRLMLQKPEVCSLLSRTKLFVASHHGRENGYVEGVFKFCAPEVIVISDKSLVHDTQDGMAQDYASQVSGNGILVHSQRRKVLTTRSDGHILVNVDSKGSATYNTIRF